MYALSRMLVAGAFLALLSSPVRVAAQDCDAERCAVTECSCEGAANHGDYVSCVAKAAGVSEECRGPVVRCAARSTCGKEGAVVCLRPKFGPCDRSTGTCRKDPSTACTSPQDCVSMKCSIKRSAERCTDHGGTVLAGATNCCAPCGVVPTTSTTTPVTTTTSTTAPGSPSGAFVTP